MHSIAAAATSASRLRISSPWFPLRLLVRSCVVIAVRRKSPLDTFVGSLVSLSVVQMLSLRDDEALKPLKTAVLQRAAGNVNVIDLVA